MSHTHTKTFTVLRESIAYITLLPYKVRVWREEPDLNKIPDEVDNRDLKRAVADAYRADESLLAIAEQLLGMDRVNAVEFVVCDVHGKPEHGGVLYKDWP